MDPTPEYIASYQDAEVYPRNLIDDAYYAASLENYKSRLDAAAAKLCISDDEKAGVPFRELDSNSDVFTKANILNQAALSAFFGDESQLNPPGRLVTKKDPKCRFIYFLATNSRAKLWITRQMLTQILSYHQVMPEYLDFLLLFGQRSGPNELRYASFREQTRFSNPQQASIMTALGRSGQQYQMCYNLKGVNCANQDAELIKREWSVRQAAVYHKFDIMYGTTLWVVTKASPDVKDRIERATSPRGRKEDRSFDNVHQSYRSSLAFHLLIAHWSGESWRWYIQWLEDVTNEVTDGAVFGTRSIGKGRQIFTARDLQVVQQYEEKCKEAVIVLETNERILEALRDYYSSLLKNAEFSLRAVVQNDTVSFCRQLKNMCHDVTMQRTRARSLADHIRDRKELILQHMQAQTAENMEGLTERTIQVGVEAQKEAIAMKIITVVTLIYLPATFVSTFFSTDVVKYQNQNGSGSATGVSPQSETSYSALAMDRWLQITVPLTLVTLTFAYLAYWWARRTQEKSWKFQYVPV